MTPPAQSGPAEQALPIHRLAAFLEGETAALNRFENVDLVLGNADKSQALLELIRLARAAGPSHSHPTLRQAVEQLRARLRENQAALQLHLDAARKISRIMVDAIERDESDRTYDRTSARALRQ